MTIPTLSFWGFWGSLAPQFSRKIHHPYQGRHRFPSPPWLPDMQDLLHVPTSGSRRMYAPVLTYAGMSGSWEGTSSWNWDEGGGFTVEGLGFWCVHVIQGKKRCNTRHHLHHEQESRKTCWRSTRFAHIKFVYRKIPKNTGKMENKLNQLVSLVVALL